MTSSDPAKDPLKEQTPANDPSMEEILASIRRILSEEEPAAPMQPEHRGPGDDVLMLEASMMVSDPPHDTAQPAPPRAEPEPHAPAPAASPAASARELVAPEAAAAAASSVGSLVRSIAAERSMLVHTGGPTIEEIVRAELRPLLKQWLDENLPPMVERLVRTELERVIGRAGS